MFVTVLFAIIICPTDELIEEGNFSRDGERIRAQIYTLLVTHGILCTLNFFMEVVPLKRARVWGTFFGLVLVIEQLVIVTEFLGYYPQPYNPELIRPIANDYFLLMIIEWVNIVGTIVSNISFLLLRSCCRHKVQFDKLPQKKQSPNVDTTIAIKQVLNIYISFAVPIYVCLTM
jgi:hypothetical protein